MICGEYIHTLDSKNRLTLPARLREQLGEQVVITKSVDKCLSLYSSKAWQTFTDKLNALPNMQTRNVRRFLFASAFETQVDSQGRILIPPQLCQYAEIGKNVRIAGVGDHAEIWNEELWNSEQSAENAAEIAETLIGLGF